MKFIGIKDTLSTTEKNLKIMITMYTIDSSQRKTFSINYDNSRFADVNSKTTQNLEM